MESTEIKIGDQVYWKKRIGFSIITLSGKVLGVDGDVLNIWQTTQHTSKPVKKNKNTVIKKQ